MDVVFGAVADSANVSQDGKLNILGIFDTINASRFPATHPSMAFAFRIRAENEDQGRKHRLEVVLIDEDGTRIWGAGAEIQVGVLIPGQFRHVNQVVYIQSAKFQKAGRYRFRVTLGDGKPHDTVFILNKVDGGTPG